MATLTPSFPLLALKNATLFPLTVLPLRVLRASTMQAVEKALLTDGVMLALSENANINGSEPLLRRYAKVGTLAKVERVSGDSKEGYQLLVRGLSRVSVEHVQAQNGYYISGGSALIDQDDLDVETRESLLKALKQITQSLLVLLPGNADEIADKVDSIHDLHLLVQICLAHMDLDFETRENFLTLNSLKQKTLNLMQHLEGKKAQLTVQHEVNGKLNERLGKQQREAILREQMRTIQEELGDPRSSQKKDYLKLILEAGMPEDVNKIAIEEFERMEAMGPQAPEASVIRNYLDLLVTLPWRDESGHTSESIDLEKAKAILKKDHEGLDDVKKKIIQSLAIAKLKKSTRGQIFLLVGPPGVGKTSLGQSIARAMNRKFTRVSLGGVRDEADIRGHRRTYIGAMPGRVIQAIKRVGSKEAVILLDEIDKVGRGSHGDPTAALLELLDPEQNSTFTDHYLDVPFDLSKIVFIATANTLETIPSALLDRMDIIELSGYSTPEKLHIAKNHLIPKIREDLGLTEAHVILEDEVLMKTIHAYTREAGVRDLNRKLTTLFRSVTEKVALGSEAMPILIKAADIEEMLGKERFLHEVIEKVAVPGVATGLAWTPMGGEILFIETNLMPGSGKLMLTGQLGDVMKESAQIALSLLRSNLAHLIPSADFAKKDIHIHVPAGATPKDGPSAGVTMLSSLASAFLKQSINPYLGMTGEITLRGAVLPVGGIKEKIIAAHRAGLRKILLSKRNERDLKDVPEEVRQDMEFHMVETVNELLAKVFQLKVLASPSRQNSRLDPDAPNLLAM